MGLPTGDEQVAPDGIGHYAYFEDGTPIYWYPVVGAWRIPNGVLRIFAAFGYEAGKFGYPTSAVSTVSIATNSGLGQSFQNGSIIYVNRGATYDYYTASYDQ